MSLKPDGIYEPRHVVALPYTIKHNDDILFIKLQEHLPDGTKKPLFKIIKNFKRPFWITKKYHRNHKQPKHREFKKNVQEYKATQKELLRSINRALGTNIYKSMVQLNDNPYVYGINIPQTVFLKERFSSRPNTPKTPYSFCALDTETDIETDTTTVITLAFDNQVSYTFYTKKYVNGVEDFEGKVRACIDKELAKYNSENNHTYHLMEVEDDLALLKESIKVLHELKPDLVGIFNIDYDIKKLIEICNRHFVDPKDIFSDPSVPKELRFFNYKEANKYIITASGKKNNIPFNEQWHQVLTPASFYFVDTMVLYKLLRVTEANLPGGYSLDNILKKILGERKLKMGLYSDLEGADWHNAASKNNPVEYAVYNIWDSISMIELEKKTTDATYKLPLFTGSTEFQYFSSSIKVQTPVLHSYLEKEFDSVLGHTDNHKEHDKNLLGLKDWIVTLVNSYVENNGLTCIEELPDHHTNIRTMTFDSDAVSSYPRNTVATNMGLETCRLELCSIEGVEKDSFKMDNISIAMGDVDVGSYCNLMFNTPRSDQLLELYKKEK